VRRDRSHPAIIAWVPTNERADPAGESLNRGKLRILAATRALDPTRLVIDTSGYCHTETGIADLHVNPTGENAWKDWWQKWREAGNFVIEELPSKGGWKTYESISIRGSYAALWSSFTSVLRKPGYHTWKV
jgi:hypothetical protein